MVDCHAERGDEVRPKADGKTPFGRYSKGLDQGIVLRRCPGEVSVMDDVIGERRRDP